MYTITKIEVFGQNVNNMGSDATEEAAAGYREWLQEKLESRFSGAEVEINEQDATYACRVEIDGEEEYLPGGFVAHMDEVEQFLSECWENCPWDWVV